MNAFLLQVSQAHLGEFIVMVVDGASSHKGKDFDGPFKNTGRGAQSMAEWAHAKEPRISGA
jgi:hypothetical protein